MELKYFCFCFCFCFVSLWFFRQKYLSRVSVGVELPLCSAVGFDEIFVAVACVLLQIPDVDASVDVPDVSGDVSVTAPDVPGDVSVTAPDVSLPGVSGEASLPSVSGDLSAPTVSAYECA